MKKRILIVDDSPAILDVMKLALEMVDCEVSTSLTGACLQQLERNLPDLILLDVLLSGEDGGEICRRLKSDELTRHIPVILISAHIGLCQRASDCGADHFLIKPFRLTELREMVKKYLALPSSTPL